MLRQFISAVVSAILKREYYCDCGFATNDRQIFESHIDRHSNAVGHIDLTSGVVFW